MSQESLANRLGLGVHQIQSYESGLRRVNALKLFELSEEFGVELEEFFADMRVERNGTDKSCEADTASGDES